MSDIRHPEDHDVLPDALRWDLRALRRDVEPSTDLWPSIAQRIAATPQQASGRAPASRTFSAAWYSRVIASASRAISALCGSLAAGPVAVGAGRSCQAKPIASASEAIRWVSSRRRV